MTTQDILKRSATQRRSSRRGSVVILVVVMLALMALLGVAYMQVARMDRDMTVTPVSNLDPAINAMVGRIQGLLLTHLNLNNNITNGRQFGADYPWNGLWSTNGTNGAPAGPMGQQDCLWLSSPAVITASGVSYHKVPLLITDYILANSSSTNWAGNNTNPTVVPVYNGSDTNTLKDTWASSGLADPVGAGIPCALLHFAPVRRFPNETFVMSAYIVDLSALVNVNTAYSFVDPATGQYNAPLTALNPNFVDIGSFVFQTTNSQYPAPQMGELTNMLNTRNAMSTNLFTAATKGAWGLDDEFQLRYKGGLVDTRIISPLEMAMTNFLRRGKSTALDERTCADFPATTGAASPTFAQMDNFLQNDPRHQMTTINGAAPLAPILPSDWGTNGYPAMHYKFDLNNNSVTNAPTAIALAGEIMSVIGTNAGYTPYPTSTPYTNPAGWIGTNSVNPQALAYTMAAGIKGYADSTNVGLISVTNGTTVFYGLKPLPFVTEVYVQRQYTAAVTNDTNTGNDVVIAWNADATAQKPGYAIEIRNPFTNTADLTVVHLKVNGNDWGPIANLVALTTNKTTLARGEAMILYRRSTSTTNSFDALETSETNTPPGLVDGAFPDGSKFPISNPWPNTSNAVTVELYASDASGLLPWAYQKVPAVGMEDSWTPSPAQTGAPGTGPVDATSRRYRQLAVLGNGNGLNAITIKDSGGGKVFSTNSQDPKFEPDTSYVYNTSLDRLGLANKTQDLNGVSGGPKDLMDPAHNQIMTANGLDLGLGKGRINYVGELAHLAVLPLYAPLAAPNTVPTIPQAWNDRATVTDFMLDFSPTAAMFAPSGNLNVPYAVVLLERFTTLRPNGETFIPGTINVNTVTTNLLMKLLPIPDQALKQTVVNQIDTYRQYPTRNGGNTRGIAFMGELYYQLSIASPNGMPGNDSKENYTMGAAATPVDYLKANGPTGIYDDREEQMLIPRMLNQMCTTRSDIFAAYVLVRGYPAGNFTLPPVEGARFLAIFDRSTVFTTGQVKLIALYRYY